MAAAVVIDDAMQWRRTICNHEAAHAVCAHLYGQPVLAIDVDRPDAGVGGQVDLERTITGNLRRTLRERAVIFRIGGLATGADWLGPDCAGDRAAVLRIADALGLPPEVLEAFAEADAAVILADSRFLIPHRALSRALLDHHHERMSGERASEIIEDALQEVALVT